MPCFHRENCTSNFDTLCLRVRNYLGEGARKRMDLIHPIKWAIFLMKARSDMCFFHRLRCHRMWRELLNCNEPDLNLLVIKIVINRRKNGVITSWGQELHQISVLKQLDLWTIYLYNSKRLSKTVVRKKIKVHIKLLIHI